MSSHTELRPPPPADEAEEERSLLADIWATISTDEFAARVLVTAIVTLAVGWLGIKEAVGAVVVSQVLTEAVKNFIRRRQPSRKRIWLVTLLLLLLQLVQRAWAAVSSSFRTKRPAPTGRRATAIMTAAVSATTVAAITVPELALGHSLTGDRDTTFFDSEGKQTPVALELTLPDPKTVEAAGRGGARVTYSATANRGVVHCRPASGSLFRIGTTKVQCVVTAPGKHRSGTFVVVVADREPPKLQLPPAINRKIVGESITIEFAATASDRVDGITRVQCRPPSGTRFALGGTTVRCSARDSHGNRVHKSFLVDVRRLPPGVPVFTLPANRIVEATGPGGAVVTYDASAVDRAGHSLGITCSPRSGALFAIGTRPVTCSATVPGGDTKRQGFPVTVRDTTKPTVQVPSDFSIEADTNDGAVVPFKVSASDLVSGNVPVGCEPASGTRLSIGSHVVSCSARDGAGNQAQLRFEVSVFDGAPALIVPADITLPYSTPKGRAVKFKVSATDRIDGPLPAACSRRPGSIFPIGKTEVKCQVTDSAGNVVSKIFTVTIVDQIPPVLRLPADFTWVAPFGSRTDVVTFKTWAYDVIDRRVEVHCKPPSGSVFVVGTSRRVFCWAADRSGNVERGSFVIKVVENPVE
jgi:large repetitive protein